MGPTLIVKNHPKLVKQLEQVGSVLPVDSEPIGDAFQYDVIIIGGGTQYCIMRDG
jgi:hypothetical protein